MTKVLTIPGINNSGPDHWQTLWEAKHDHIERIQQADWDFPHCEDWVKNIESAVQKSGADTILVAHSLGTLALAQWIGQTKLPIKAALFVSIPDPQGINFPKEAQGFDSIPNLHLSFPSIIVMSTDDPYGNVDKTKALAQAWGSELVVIENCGHINASSNLGEWQEGLELLRRLQAL